MTNSPTDNVPTVQPKILVLGATGGAGRLIVSQALARGYDVAALVRSPEKARDLKGIRLNVGDARDARHCTKRSKAATLPQRAVQIRRNSDEKR